LKLLSTFDRIEAVQLEQKTAQFPQVWAVLYSATITYFILTVQIISYGYAPVKRRKLE